MEDFRVEELREKEREAYLVHGLQIVLVKYTPKVLHSLKSI